MKKGFLSQDELGSEEPCSQTMSLGMAGMTEPHLVLVFTVLRLREEVMLTNCLTVMAKFANWEVR